MDTASARPDTRRPAPVRRPGVPFVMGIVLLLGLAASVSAQPATLSGFVTDRTDGQPLEFVNVVLRSGEDVVRGVTTNQDGLFMITRVPAGTYAVTASFVGYETFADTVALSPGQVQTLNVALAPGQEALDEVVVEAAGAGGAARVTAGRQTVRPADIEYVPTPDVAGDLAGYLSAQPGIVTTGDRGGQFFVRGGEPSQNLVLLDGILVYQPFHILGFYSAFPADLLNRVDVYAGGYGSEYGGRISSVIDVSTRTGNSRSFAGAVSASPFVSAAQVEGPLVQDRVSLLASLRQSTIAQGAARYVDAPLPFTFGDVFAKLHAVPTDNSRASVTALRTYDRGTLSEDVGGAPAQQVRWRNDAVGGRLLVLPRIFSVMADLHLSYSRLRSELGPRGDPVRTSTIENTFVAIEATYFGDRVDVETGSMLRFGRLDSEIGGLFQNVELRRSRVSTWGTYLTLDLTLGRGWRLLPGLRAQFYAIRFEPYVEPRLRVVWERGPHQLSAAAGLYHQEVIGLNDRRDAASVFTVWAHIPRQSPTSDVRHGRMQRAVHALAGYSVRPAPWLEWSVEGYFKHLGNLFISEWSAHPRFTTRLQPASGRSAGFDTRLSLEGGAFHAFVTYGFSDTRYTAEQASLQLWYGEERLRFRPPHDRRHQVSVLAGTEVLGFDLNARWDFGSGLPFSQAVGFDGFAVVDDLEKAADLPTSRRVIYGEPYGATLPTYHRLDVSVERTFDAGPADVTILASVINVYDRRNLFYLDVFTLRRVDQLPLVPSLGIEVAFR